MTKELATITPYTPPYWHKRVWNPSGRNAWERKVLVALELGSAESLEKLLAQREKTARWREPYGKTRAFALDYTADIIQGKRFVRLALTPQKLFQQWRTGNARMDEAWDVAASLYRSDWSHVEAVLAQQVRK